MFLKGPLRRLIHYYETKVAPSKIGVIYWPLYKFFKSKKICFVVNIASGVGHTTAELDFFLRKKFLKEINKDKKFVIVRKPDPYSNAIDLLYKRHFYKIFVGYFWYFLFLPLTVRYKSITEDCGLSRLKWQIDKGRVSVIYPNNYLYQVTKKEGIERLSYYYRLCSKSSSYFPLCEIDSNVYENLSFLDEKMALVQIKTKIVNATAKPTDPKTLLPALKLLQKLGYQLIFVGREKMPDVFIDLKMFNYSESNWASYTNDILLFSKASLVITSGSGISFLADRFDIPYLYLNSWQLQMSMPSKKAIMVPALVANKNNNKLLKFSEQINLYESRKDIGEEIFPEDHYEAINANDEEILEALNELLAMPGNPSDLQMQYSALSPDSPLEYGLSKCSQFFLLKHKLLL